MVNGEIIDDEGKLKVDDTIEISGTVLLFTDQIEIPVKSVEDYERLIKSQTRSIDLPPTLS